MTDQPPAEWAVNLADQLLCESDGTVEPGNVCMAGRLIEAEVAEREADLREALGTVRKCWDEAVLNAAFQRQRAEQAEAEVARLRAEAKSVLTMEEQIARLRAELVKKETRW